MFFSTGFFPTPTIEKIDNTPPGTIAFLRLNVWILCLTYLDLFITPVASAAVTMSYYQPHLDQRNSLAIALLLRARFCLHNLCLFQKRLKQKPEENRRKKNWSCALSWGEVVGGNADDESMSIELKEQNKKYYGHIDISAATAVVAFSLFFRACARYILWYVM